MNVEFQPASSDALATLAVDALVWLLPEQPEDLTGDDALQSWARALAAQGWPVEVGKALTVYALPGVTARWLVAVRVAADSAPESVRKATQAGVGALRSLRVARAAWALTSLPEPHLGVEPAMMALAEGLYCYTTTKLSVQPDGPRSVALALPSSPAARDAFARGRALAIGIQTAMEWANRPANHATPSHLAEAALELGRRPGLKVDVMGPQEVEALGMGAFLAVARGSREPLRFITLRHAGGRRNEAPIVLVGKGITFDTGGISIKPAPEMDEMKFDMSGAAAVLGVFAALAELRPSVHVVGLIPACENMPDGRAVKPGDVVTTLSGQTVEVLNTDAEGRLILCDALTYARRFNPRQVIDIATLTGACVIALGAVRSGLFANDDALAGALQTAGEQAMDRCWRMPLDEEYGEGLKSNFADLANVAGRAAGAVTAAKFLQRFVDGLAWAHLDIAGTAWRGGAAKGATGRPVALLLRHLLMQADAMPRPTKSTKVRV